MKIVENQHDIRVPFAELENGTVFDGIYIKGKRYTGTECVTCYTSLYTGIVYDVSTLEMKGDKKMTVFPNKSATVVIEGLE